MTTQSGGYSRSLIDPCPSPMMFADFESPAYAEGCNGLKLKCTGSPSLYGQGYKPWCPLRCAAKIQMFSLSQIVNFSLLLDKARNAGN